jgi:hypothetical protein
MVDWTQRQTRAMREAADAAARARAYLDATDWYVVRAAETGIPVPAEIEEGRKVARFAADTSQGGKDGESS